MDLRHPTYDFTLDEGGLGSNLIKGLDLLSEGHNLRFLTLDSENYTDPILIISDTHGVGRTFFKIRGLDKLELIYRGQTYPGRAWVHDFSPLERERFARMISNAQSKNADDAQSKTRDDAQSKTGDDARSNQKNTRKKSTRIFVRRNFRRGVRRRFRRRE